MQSSVIPRYLLFSFLSGFHFFSAVLVPIYTEWAGVSLAVAYTLQSWFMFWLFVLEVPTGAVADKLGRKHSVALGCFFLIISTLIYGAVPNIVVFALAEFFFAVSAALISGADKALLYDTLVVEGKESKATQLFGKSRAIHLIGLMIASPVGGIMASALGINAPMLLTSVSALASFLVILTIPEPTNKRGTRSSKNYRAILKQGLKTLTKNHRLVSLTVNAVIVATAAYYVIWLYQPLMITLHIPVGYFRLAHTGLVLSEVVVAASFARFEKWFGSTKNFLRFSAFITAASLLLAGIFPSNVSLITLLVLAGGFGLTRLELMEVHMNRHIDSETRATTLSFISMTKRMSLFILNPIVGLISSPSLLPAFVLAGTIPLLVILFPLSNGEIDKE